jgi:hypothetical protein
MRASMRMPMRAVAKRRVKLPTNRTAARMTIARMYGHNGFRCETIESSTARCVSSGIAIEMSV